MNFLSGARFRFAMKSLFVFCGWASFAQPMPDSTIHLTESYPVSFYKKTVDSNTRIVNGREYKLYRSEKDETPYLFLQWAMAELIYDEQLYTIPIMVDLSKNAVIINHNGGFLQLVNERLTRFKVKGRTFIHLNQRGLNAGFYELLYDGTMKVYSNRQKKFKKVINGMEIIGEFEEILRFYMVIANEPNPVSNKKEILALFPNQLQAIKSYIKKNNLHFKKHFESDLIALSAFCDRLE